MIQLTKINFSTRQFWVKKSDLKIFDLNHGALKDKSVCVSNQLGISGACLYFIVIHSLLHASYFCICFIACRFMYVNFHQFCNRMPKGEIVMICVVLAILQLIQSVDSRNNMEGGIDDFLLETEDEIVAENRNIVEDEMLGDDGIVVPKIGMIFSSENEMFELYKEYAYNVGRRPSTATGSVRPQPTIQTNCKARISASSDDHGSWRINAVHLDHNHGTSPSKSRLFRCNRELSAQVKRRLEVNDVAGIPLHKSYNSAVVEAGGYENMLVWKMIVGTTSNNIDLDDESRLRNIFWADNRCRQAYKEFGDVVTFDTTYLTNKYDMPFASFVGVNHHGQSTLLGCGLLSNEDTNSFVWLFRSWLQCMHSVAPHGIITDQDRAMQNAIQIVFPNTNHRWCLWHILKKLPEKFGYYIDKGSIFSHIHGLVYDSQFVEEFEEGWIAMINKFELHENDWLSRLYENIKRWVPCFLKTTFWAEMSTMQRSEYECVL
ncbi:protein FAR1-RELATED SEQUENCE 5-like [Olea europaea var. sylvestris]|uniref:protein FAR1-RELATED SEQUENCE 5-like n=1 Tax=Olea europaea var. sylvestris TaxID=158386 RepID=UPI000C1D5595|nr:protein FAR1-RELATED SEQUENCE 5-like [Olea europaea var. sylvestris]